MGRLWLLAAGIGGALAFVAFLIQGSRRGAAPLTPESLLERVARDAPDFLTGGPMLHATDGAVVALERTGHRLALLLPQGVFWVVPATRARVEWARPPVLAVKTGNRSRPWVRAELPEGTPGTEFLRLLGGVV